MSSLGKVTLALCFMRERPYGGRLCILNMAAHAAWGGWCSNEVHGAYEVGLWNNIKRGWGDFFVILDLRLVMTPELDSGMTYGVGDHALNAAFPDLFSLACCKDASVVDHLEFFNYSSIENYLF
jgi:hypothetical protein